jgi:hypothetical protein
VTLTASLERAQGDRLTDYPRWHRAQVITGDIDPMYPVLLELSDIWRLDYDQRAWLVFLHVAWYHPGSTLAAFQRVPNLDALPRTYDDLDAAGLLSLPTGTERRGHRSKDALAKHLIRAGDVLRAAGGYLPWVEQGRDEFEGTLGWTRTFDWLTNLPGNGRWAAYKSVEMLQKVAALPIEAADAGHRFSSGPRKGLADLGLDVPGNGAAAVRELDDVTAALAADIGESDIAQVETSLCDFHSLVSGHYYLGHDIDAMLDAFLSERLPAGSVTQAAWDARIAAFDDALLGEHNGWTGVRRDLNTRYRMHGEMVGVA